jgi:hypothetical protein
MTWMHWLLFAVLSVLALGVAFDRRSTTATRLSTFALLIGLVLLLVLGQPK